jgi:hypothetical protein
LRHRNGVPGILHGGRNPVINEHFVLSLVLF